MSKVNDTSKGCRRNQDGPELPSGPSRKNRISGAMVARSHPGNQEEFSMLTNVNVPLEEDVIALIDKACGGPAAQAGVRAGRTNWVREAVFMRLGIPIPPDHRAIQAQKIRAKVREDVSRVLALPNLDPVHRRIATLRGEGCGLDRICQDLQSHGIQSPRGKSWHPQSVRLVLRGLGIP